MPLQNKKFTMRNKLSYSQEPTGIQRFPNEIINKIAQSLSVADAYQCMFVCKSWYKVVLPIFYRDFFIDKRKYNVIGPRVVSVKKYGEMDQDIKRHSHLIKSIRIEDEVYPAFLPFTFLALLLYYTPNLETIDVSASQNTYSYVKALTIPELLAKKRRIEQIKIHSEFNFDSIVGYSPNSWNCLNEYLYTCYAYREYIKHFELHDIHSTICMMDGTPCAPLKILDHFPRLTHLTISANEVDRYLDDQHTPMNEVDTVEYILKHFSDLESLKLLHYYNVTDALKRNRYHPRGRHVGNNLIIEETQEELARIELQKNVLRIAQNPKYLLHYIFKAKDVLNWIATKKDEQLKPSKQSHPKLKSLTYVTPHLSQNEVECLTSNISFQNLRSLTLVVNRLCTLEWLHHVGFKKAFEFAQYLSQVKNLQFRFIHSEKATLFGGQKTCSPIQEMWTRTLFWTFINEIRGRRNLKYSIHLDVSNDDIVFDRAAKSKVNEMMKTIHIEQEITMNSLLYFDYVQNDNLKPQNVLPNEIQPPKDVLLPQIVKETKDLTINIPLKSNCLRELQFVLKEFTQLHKLIIRSGKSPHGRSVFERSIKFKTDSSFSDTTSPQWTRAAFRNIDLTPQFCTTFISGLSHLTSLRLADCNCFGKDGSISKNPILDLRQLNNLKSLSMWIKYDIASYHKVLARIQYYHQSKPHCERQFRTNYEDKVLEESRVVVSKGEEKDPFATVLTVKAGHTLTKVKFYKSF